MPMLIPLVCINEVAILGLMFVQNPALETKGRQVEEIQRMSSEWAEIL